MTEDISACRKMQTWELESPVNLIPDTERESHNKTRSNTTLWHTKNQDAKSISKGRTEGASMTHLISNMPKKIEARKQQNNIFKIQRDSNC